MNNCTPEIMKELQDAAAAHGVPAEYLVTMANIESSCHPAAVNKTTKATGLFQFLPKAAKDVKLKLSDRSDVHKSSLAAAQYTKQNLQTLRQLGVSVDLKVNPEFGYLAHQQGAHGLANLIKAARTNGKVTPAMRKSMDLNYGKGKTPKEFLELWKKKYQDMANGKELHAHHNTRRSRRALPKAQETQHIHSIFQQQPAVQPYPMQSYPLLLP